MSEEQTNAPRRLRWWFWVVLFAPALVVISAPLAVPAQQNLQTGMLVIEIGLVINFLCSIWAAKQIVRLRDPRGGLSPWMLLWGPVVFFLNVALAFGGCAASEQLVRSIQ